MVSKPVTRAQDIGAARASKGAETNPELGREGAAVFATQQAPVFSRRRPACCSPGRIFLHAIRGNSSLQKARRVTVPNLENSGDREIARPNPTGANTMPMQGVGNPSTVPLFGYVTLVLS